MDFMKIFKRQKSVGKKASQSLDISDEHSDLAFDKIKEPAKPCDVNLNSKDTKDGKSWRKSIRKSFRRRKETQSNSCDNILQQNADLAPNGDDIPSSYQTNRWSYSPEHTSGFTFDPTLQDDSLLSRLSRRNTEGGLVVDEILRQQHIDKHRSYDLTIDNDVHEESDQIAFDTGTVDCGSEDAFIVQPESVNRNDNSHTPQFSENGSEYPSRHMSTFKDPASPQPAGDIQPHPTLFEHDAESALSAMKQYETQEPDKQYEMTNADEHTEYSYDNEQQSHEYTYIEEESANVDDASGSGWPSEEFDTDSENGDESYDNDLIDEGLEKNQSDEKPSFFRKNIELGKEFSEGVKKLKFLRKSGVTKKNSREEDPSSFIDVNLSKERHPGPHLRTPPPGLQPYQLKRRNIVETIINSESSFIDSLERLEISYKKALLDAKPAILSSEHVDRIFYKIAEILQCHQLFQIALTSAVTNWDEHETIGDTFVASFSKLVVLECYSSYINNFTTAMELVRKSCKQKPQFLTFLRDRQNESQNRLNLYGLMLKPVQRFPQFIMLVQDLLKHTPHDHADRLPLQLALTELETLAENLNQRRADDEERSAMIQLIESSNIKLQYNQTKDGRTRRLLKQGDVREQTFSEEGTVEKDRECLLALANDVLLCFSSPNRRQQLRSGTFRDIYKLKWSAHLNALTILDGHDSVAAKEYKNMRDDLSTLRSISELIKSLHYPLSNLSVQEVEPNVTALEAKIKQTELSNHDSSDISFSVHFQQKSVDFKRTLVMSDNQHCNEWLESIINAKLANDVKNLHCWFSADGSDGEYLWKPPLFLDYVKCQDSQKPLQVQCAYAFMPSSHITLLWLACSASTVISVVNVYKVFNEKTEKVYVTQVESSVQCMEFWNPDQESPSVWLGMECGSLIEFNAGGSYSKLCEVTMPTMSTVMIMKAYKRNLYVGLLDGSLLMYTRYEGLKGLVHVQSITVGDGPLNCLSPLDGKLWGASGNDIVTINLEDFKMESMRTISTEESLTVSHVVQVGTGLWVAFCDTCSLHLYHLETLKLVQDLNLSRPIRDFFQGLGWTSRVNENCFITSMWSSYWQLLIGTSNGIVMTMPLPKLPGSVPKITGPCRICYHMLSGPVTFLCAPAMPPPKKIENITQVENKDDEKPPDIPERSPIKQTHNHKFGSFKHERTSSEGLLNLSDVSPASSFKKSGKTRFSIAEPPNHSAYHNPGEIAKVHIPPALPPKPSTPRKDEVIAENLLEDDFVFHSKKVATLPSPSHAMEKQLTQSRARNFPVLLALGEGYKYSGHSDGPEPAQRATTILTWKIVL